MHAYWYQLKSSRQLFPRTADWLAYVAARALRKAPQSLTPRSLRKRPFRLIGLDQPVILRPQMQDFSVARELFLRREYHDVQKWVAASASLVVDLGANIGLSVRLWQSLFPTARIVAVEPDADNASICRENVALGPHPDRVTIWQAAVAAHSGTAYLQKSHSSLGHQTSSQYSESALAVHAVSMRELLGSLSDPPTIDLLKCDIEGGEQELFADCRSWIDRVQTLIVEVHGTYGVAELLADVDRNGGKFCVESTDTRHPNLAIVCLRSQTRPLAQASTF
jgi:FkbM family methyltransferase